MQVSLNITGDASGARQALQDTSGGLDALGSKAAATSQTIGDAFNKANDSIAQMAKNSSTVSVANDNTAAAAVGLAQKIGDLATKTLGANSAFAKAATGASGLVEGVGAVARSATGVSLLTGGIGLAITAASTLYGIFNDGGAKAAKNLDDQARLVNTVRDAYKNAATAAGSFLNESKDVTLFLLEQKQKSLQDDLVKLSRGAVSDFDTGATIAAIIQQNNFGVGGGEGSPNDAEVKNYQLLQTAVTAFNASIAAGLPDLDAYKASLVAIARSDTSAAALATSTIEKIKETADKTASQLKDGAAAINKIKGIATTKDDVRLGTGATVASTNEFDRLAKSMDRQSASQTAEAQAAGLGAGAAAKLRTEFVLTEAAQQSGIVVAGAYADKIKAIADRAGQAAQKLAEAKLASDTAFATSQLGRNTIDASVADQLKGVFGNNADQNSAIANAIRFNEQMKDLKSTVSDIANGAFTDFRVAVQNGATAMQALGTVSNNVLNKIIDKLGNKILDNGISALFGAFIGPSTLRSSGSASAGTSGALSGALSGAGGFDVGGYTGEGPPHDVAGFVHRNEYVFDAVSTGRAGVPFLANLHRQLRGYSDGGLVGGGPAGSPSPMMGSPVYFSVNVENHNGSDVSVQRKQNQSGGVDLRLMIRQAVGEDLSKGKHDQAMGGRFGLKPKVGVFG